MFHSVIDIIGITANPCYIMVVATLLFLINKEKDFSGLIYLLFFTMIYNTVFKYIFEIPLPESCHKEGFGFPSGHTNFSAVFFIWIFLNYKNNMVRSLSVICFIAMAWFIVFRGYHYLRDVVFTVPFSFCAVCVYKKFISNLDEDRKFLYALCASTLMLIALGVMKTPVFPHALLAYYSIFGVGVSYLIFNQSVNRKQKLQQVLLVALSSFVVLSVNNSVYHILSKIQWFFVFLPIYLLKNCVHQIKERFFDRSDCFVRKTMRELKHGDKNCK